MYLSDSEVTYNKKRSSELQVTLHNGHYFLMNPEHPLLFISNTQLIAKFLLSTEAAILSQKSHNITLLTENQWICFALNENFRFAERIVI